VTLNTALVFLRKDIGGGFVEHIGQT